MRPVVEPAERVPPDRVVPGELTPAAFERRQDLGADRGGADRVEQNLDPEARRALRGQRLRELPSDISGPVDVRLDGDRKLGARDRLEHGRIESVAVVQDIEAVTWRERDPRCARHRREEFFVGDRKLVVQTVTRRELGRRDQIADEAHQPRTERPPPLVVGHVVNEREGPRPPRPQQAAGARPERQQSLGPALQRIGGQAISPMPGHAAGPPAQSLALRHRLGRARPSGGGASDFDGCEGLVTPVRHVAPTHPAAHQFGPGCAPQDRS